VVGSGPKIRVEIDASGSTLLGSRRFTLLMKMQSNGSTSSREGKGHIQCPGPFHINVPVCSTLDDLEHTLKVTVNSAYQLLSLPDGKNET